MQGAPDVGSAGPADYILFVDRLRGGVIEAKKPEEAEKFAVHGSVHLDRDDLELGTMSQQGGLARMHQLFGEGMDILIDELNEVLAA